MPATKSSQTPESRFPMPRSEEKSERHTRLVQVSFSKPRLLLHACRFTLLYEFAQPVFLIFRFRSFAAAARNNSSAKLRYFSMKLDSSEFRAFSGREGPASKDGKKRAHVVCGSLADILGNRPSLLLISSVNRNQPSHFGQKLVHTNPSLFSKALPVPFFGLLFSRI